MIGKLVPRCLGILPLNTDSIMVKIRFNVPVSESQTPSEELDGKVFMWEFLFHPVSLEGNQRNSASFPLSAPRPNSDFPLLSTALIT